MTDGRWIILGVGWCPDFSWGSFQSTFTFQKMLEYMGKGFMQAPARSLYSSELCE